MSKDKKIFIKLKKLPEKIAKGIFFTGKPLKENQLVTKKYNIAEKLGQKFLRKTIPEHLVFRFLIS